MYSIHILLKGLEKKNCWGKQYSFFMANVSCITNSVFRYNLMNITYYNVYVLHKYKAMQKKWTYERIWLSLTAWPYTWHTSTHTWVCLFMFFFCCKLWMQMCQYIRLDIHYDITTFSFFVSHRIFASHQ